MYTHPATFRSRVAAAQSECGDTRTVSDGFPLKAATRVRTDSKAMRDKSPTPFSVPGIGAYKYPGNR